jgi:hypothetical protein
LRPERKYSSMLSPPFLVKTRPMPIESAKYATTIAQSIAERFMDAP